MLTIINREINAFFSSIFGFIILGMFLTAIGLVCWVFPDSNIFDYGFADMNTFFALCPSILLFFVPAIAMKAFAEEKKQGTLELLLTKPISITQLVLGKYFAIILILILSLLPTLIYYFSIREIGSPKNNIDSAVIIGSYLGLILLGGVFAALSLVFSSITNNQIIAFVLAVFSCFILYFGFSSLSSLFESSSIKYFINLIGLDTQYQALGRGLIDSRNVIYLLSLIFFGVFSTVQMIKKG